MKKRPDPSSNKQNLQSIKSQIKAISLAASDYNNQEKLQFIKDTALKLQKLFFDTGIHTFVFKELTKTKDFTELTTNQKAKTKEESDKTLFLYTGSHGNEKGVICENNDGILYSTLIEKIINLNYKRIFWVIESCKSASGISKYLETKILHVPDDRSFLILSGATEYAYVLPELMQESFLMSALFFYLKKNKKDIIDLREVSKQTSELTALLSSSGSEKFYQQSEVFEVFNHGQFLFPALLADKNKFLEDISLPNHYVIPEDLIKDIQQCTQGDSLITITGAPLSGKSSLLRYLKLNADRYFSFDRVYYCSGTEWLEQLFVQTEGYKPKINNTIDRVLVLNIVKTKLFKEKSLILMDDIPLDLKFRKTGFIQFIDDYNKLTSSKKAMIITSVAILGVIKHTALDIKNCNNEDINKLFLSLYPSGTAPLQYHQKLLELPFLMIKIIMKIALKKDDLHALNLHFLNKKKRSPKRKSSSAEEKKDRLFIKVLKDVLRHSFSEKEKAVLAYARTVEFLNEDSIAYLSQQNQTDYALAFQELIETNFLEAVHSKNYQLHKRLSKVLAESGLIESNPFFLKTSLLSNNLTPRACYLSLKGLNDEEKKEKIREIVKYLEQRHQVDYLEEVFSSNLDDFIDFAENILKDTGFITQPSIKKTAYLHIARYLNQASIHGLASDFYREVFKAQTLTPAISQNDYHKKIRDFFQKNTNDKKRLNIRKFLEDLGKFFRDIIEQNFRPLKESSFLFIEKNLFDDSLKNCQLAFDYVKALLAVDFSVKSLPEDLNIPFDTQKISIIFNRELYRQQTSFLKRKGITQENLGQYKEALSSYQEAYNICKTYGLSSNRSQYFLQSMNHFNILINNSFLNCELLSDLNYKYNSSTTTSTQLTENTYAETINDPINTTIDIPNPSKKTSSSTQKANTSFAVDISNKNFIDILKSIVNNTSKNISPEDNEDSVKNLFPVIFNRLGARSAFTDIFRQLLLTNQLEKAEKFFIWKTDDKFCPVDIEVLRGDVFAAQGKYQDALKVFDLVIGRIINKNNQEHLSSTLYKTYLKKALVLNKQKRFVSAMSNINNSLRILKKAPLNNVKPFLIQAHIFLADVCIHLKKINKAIESLDQAEQEIRTLANPKEKIFKQGEILLKQSKLYFIAGQWGEALKKISQFFRVPFTDQFGSKELIPFQFKARILHCILQREMNQNTLAEESFSILESLYYERIEVLEDSRSKFENKVFILEEIKDLYTLALVYKNKTLQNIISSNFKTHYDQLYLSQENKFLNTYQSIQYIHQFYDLLQDDEVSDQAKESLLTKMNNHITTSFKGGSDLENIQKSQWYYQLFDAYQSLDANGYYQEKQKILRLACSVLGNKNHYLKVKIFIQELILFSNTQMKSGKKITKKPLLIFIKKLEKTRQICEQLFPQNLYAQEQILFHLIQLKISLKTSTEKTFNDINQLTKEYHDLYIFNGWKLKGDWEKTLNAWVENLKNAPYKIDETLYHFSSRVLRQLDMRGINTVLKPKLRFECLKYFLDQEGSITDINEQYQQIFDEYERIPRDKQYCELHIEIAELLHKTARRKSLKSPEKSLLLSLASRSYRIATKRILKRSDELELYDVSEARAVSIVYMQSKKIKKDKQHRVLLACRNYIQVHQPNSPRIVRINKFIEKNF